MRITDVVPAPEEPLTETIGCLRDMLPLSSRWTRGFLAGGRAEQPANSVKREVLSGLIVLTMVFLDALDLLGRTKHERDALVQTVGNYVEHSLPSGARRATGLLDEEGHRVRLVEQPQLGGVDREFAGGRGDLNGRAGEDELTERSIEGECVHAGTHAQHEHC